MHVGGFTQSPTSRVARPGTYLGLIEKIPYLQSLGVTAVELMPVLEFPIQEWDGSEPVRRNYWGYDPLALFAPIAATPTEVARRRSTSSRRWCWPCTRRASK